MQVGPVGIGVEVVKENRGRPAKQLRRMLFLTSNKPGIGIKDLIGKAEEYFSMKSKSVYAYLNKEFRLRFRFLFIEFHMRVFPFVLYRFIPFDKKRIYFTGRPPAFISILQGLNAALILIETVERYLQGDYALAIFATVALLIGIPCLFLRWWIGRMILKHYDIAIGKITCIVRHGKDILLSKKFSLDTKVYEIKESALKEMERKRGKPVRREYLLYLVDKSGTRIHPELTSTLYPYALNNRRLFFELVCKNQKLTLAQNEP